MAKYVIILLNERGTVMKKFMLFGLVAFALAACSDTNDGTSITCGGYDIAINMAADGESMTAVINGD